MRSNGSVEPSIGTTNCHAHNVCLRSDTDRRIYNLFEYILNGRRIEQCSGQPCKLAAQRTQREPVIACGGNPLPGSFIGVGNESLPVANPRINGMVHWRYLFLRKKPARRSASDLSREERWLAKCRCWLIKGAAAAVRRWNQEINPSRSHYVQSSPCRP